MVKRISIVLLLLITLMAGCDSGDDWEAAEPEAAPPAESEPVEQEEAAELAIPAAPEGERVTMHKWDLWTGSSPALRGVNIWQREVYEEIDGPEFLGSSPVGPPYTQADFDLLAAWGANYVNISHPGLYTIAPPYALDEGIQANLDTLLTQIGNADMFAVISFRSGPGRAPWTFNLEGAGDWYPRDYLNDSVWEDPAAQQGWAQMWRYTAERYAGHPVVVGYDLMVEPNAPEVFFEEYEPDIFHASYIGTGYDWNTWYPSLIDAIRAADPSTPILVGGSGYSAIEWLPYLETVDDPYTAYMVHLYTPYAYTHQEPGPLRGLDISYPDEVDLDWDNVPDSFDRAWNDSLLNIIDDYEIEHTVEVHINEFGPMRFEPGAADYLDDIISLFEKRGINYAQWVWGPAWAPFREEPQGFDIRLGTDLDNMSTDVDSAIKDVLTRYWGQNTFRPSVVEFEE